MSAQRTLHLCCRRSKTCAGAGPELDAAATQLFCLEAAVSEAATAGELEGEEQAALSRAVVEALLDGSTPGLMAPSLRGLYRRALSRRVADDPISKARVILVMARTSCVVQYDCEPGIRDDKRCSCT